MFEIVIVVIVLSNVNVNDDPRAMFTVSVAPEIEMAVSSSSYPTKD